MQQRIAIYDSAAAIGIFATPLIAIFLFRFFPWRGVLGVMGFVFVLVAITVYFLFNELKVSRVTKAVFEKFIRRRALVFVLLWFRFLIISGASTMFVALAGVKLTGIALFLAASFIYGFFPAGLIAITKIFDINVRGLATGFILGFGVIIG